MGTYTLTPAEKLLFEKTKHGDPAEFKHEEHKRIRAPVLRHIVLGLPVIEDDRRTLRAITSLFGEPEEGRRCPVTGVGIAISDATIEGRLKLDAAIGEEGGPICPLEFTNCHFEQGLEADGVALAAGFSGRNARFARLGLRSCTFSDPKKERGSAASVSEADSQAIPTINLSGARVEGDLDMRGSRPEIEQGLLWIRATGIRVDGEVDLSCCHLRAPDPKPSRPVYEEADDALNLALAEIRGDLQLLGACIVRGRIKLRAAHIGGDAWMTGADIAVDKGDALFLQGARIDGFLMLNGGWEKVCERLKEQGAYLEFRSAGTLNLRSAEIGRSLYLNNAVIQGNLTASDLTVQDDLFLGADVGGSIDLGGCRIAGSLDISDLSLASFAKSFSLRDGCVGRSLKLVKPAPCYRLVKSRRIGLNCLPGADFIETLWHHDGGQSEQRQSGTGGPPPNPEEGSADSPEHLPLDRQLVQAGFLRYRGRILHLDGHADNLSRAAAWFGDFVRSNPPEEAVRIRRAYSLRHETGAPRRDGETAGAAPAGQFRFKGGLILLPHKPDAELKAAIGAKEWITDPLWKGMDERPRDRRLEALLRSYVQPRALLQGEIVLENLSCDMLDDQAGRGWSAHLDRILMNHFVYHRTTWQPEQPRRKKGLFTRPRPGFRKRIARLWKKVSGGRGLRGLPRAIAGLAVGAARQVEKWYLHLEARRLRLLAQLTPIWGAWLFNRADRWRVGEHWGPIETKRNWIYRQFNTAGLASSSKYRIRSAEYRSQPFEQVIKVARSEGREDYALYFEILKERIEWDLFSTRHRGWFTLLGVAVALAWWSLGEGVRLSTVLIVIVAFTLLPTFANWVMYRGFGYLRRPIRAICTLIVAFLIGWWGVAVANRAGMLVINLAPVASMVAEPRAKVAGAARSAVPAAGPAGGGAESRDPSRLPLIGAPRAAPNAEVVNFHCAGAINEALYALDVLIPLIDLREENRCDVGLATGADLEGRRFERLFFEDPTTFWDVMKALYAIAGWFIVSLAIMTFAHVTRHRPEPT